MYKHCVEVSSPAECTSVQRFCAKSDLAATEGREKKSSEDDDSQSSRQSSSPTLEQTVAPVAPVKKKSIGHRQTMLRESGPFCYGGLAILKDGPTLTPGQVLDAFHTNGPTD